MKSNVLDAQLEAKRETPLEKPGKAMTKFYTKAKAPADDSNPTESGPIPTFVAGAKLNQTLKSSRAAVAYAPPLTGITIDGQLDDWPVTIARHPIDKLLITNGVGTGGLSGTNLTTSADLSAAFSVGYDPKEGYLYLAVIVRDDKIVIGHSSHLDTDALEVYVGGLLSDRRMSQGLTKGAFDKLELADLPVQQYIAIPGKGHDLRRATGEQPHLDRRKPAEHPVAHGLHPEGGRDDV